MDSGTAFRETARPERWPLSNALRIPPAAVLFDGDLAAVRSQAHDRAPPARQYGPRTKAGLRADGPAVPPVRPILDLLPGPRNENYPASCIVRDCLMHDLGTVEKQVAGVFISKARDILVSHLSIYDVPRAAININDGMWGGRTVEWCDIFTTCRESREHGSINSWGRDRFRIRPQPGKKTTAEENIFMRDHARLDTVDPITLRYNRVQCAVGYDIDLDDGSSHYVIENNLFATFTVPEHFRRLDLDRHSLTATPQFVNAVAADYRVRPGSPAERIGFANFPMDRFGVTSPHVADSPFSDRLSTEDRRIDAKAPRKHPRKVELTREAQLRRQLLQRDVGLGQKLHRFLHAPALHERKRRHPERLTESAVEILSLPTRLARQGGQGWVIEVVLLHEIKGALHLGRQVGGGRPVFRMSFQRLAQYAEQHAEDPKVRLRARVKTESVQVTIGRRRLVEEFTDLFQTLRAPAAAGTGQADRERQLVHSQPQAPG